HVMHAFTICVYTGPHDLVTTSTLRSSYNHPRPLYGRSDHMARPGAAQCCAVLRTASCPASMAGPIAVRSTQFGGGSCRILRVLWRKQWVEGFRYVALVTCLGWTATLL